MFLMVSYENSITIQITALTKNKPFENFQHFLKSGYKINYPHGTHRQDVRAKTGFSVISRKTLKYIKYLMKRKCSPLMNPVISGNRMLV